MVDTTHIFCAGLSLEASQSTAEGFHTQIHMGTRTLHQDTAGCEREGGGGGGGDGVYQAYSIA